MKHGKKLKKLNRRSSHRKSLLMNLAISLFKHERIKTTLPKAKALRPYAEKLITKAKDNSLHTIRQLSGVISDKSIVKKLTTDLGERFKTRPGGYTRIYRCGFRTNDSAPLALIELVDYTIKRDDAGVEKTAHGGTTVKEKIVSLISPKEVEVKAVEEAPAPKAKAKPRAKAAAKSSKK